MADTSYTMAVRVTLTDLDLRDEVSSASFLRYFEETAMRASGHMGFTFNWYRERGQFWVIRTMRFERRAAAHYQDELEIRTWISSLSRVRSDRNYLVRRVSDDQVLARATANWVYVDAKSLVPARIAPEIVAAFSYTDPAALPPRPRRAALVCPDEKLQGVTTRRAQYYEADSGRHTNNAIYADWLEEAVRDTLLAQGYLLPLDSGPALWFYRHTLEYLNSARPGDQVEIATRLAGRGHSAGNWEQTIRRIPSGEVLMRGECVTLWRDERNHVCPWPRA